MRLYHTAIALVAAGDEAMLALEDQYDATAWTNDTSSLVSALLTNGAVVLCDRTGVCAYDTESPSARASVECDFY